MIEPVALGDFFLTFFSSALVVLFGAAYAAAFAWAKLRRRKAWFWLAYGFYAALVASSLILARTANLNGPWTALTLLLLLGYWFAPYGIWRLCSATHVDE